MPWYPTNAGDLDRLVEIQTPSYNAAGDEIESWDTVDAEVWACIDEYGGDESESEGMRRRSWQMATIYIRYREDLNTPMRIVDGGRTWDVRSLGRLRSSRGHMLQMKCREVL